jgi:predicted nucleic acid-binding protein
LCAITQRLISRKMFAMGIVVSDSSTLIHLAAIGRIDLLRTFFERIVIPPAVWEEVVVEGRERAGALEVEQAKRAGWIEIQTATNLPLLRLLEHQLDAGEAQVIALAVEQSATLILLDESEARQIAALYNLPKTGTIGILIRAKQEGKIESLRTELDRLRGPGGFWIEESLYHQALQAVGEKSVVSG